MCHVQATNLIKYGYIFVILCDHSNTIQFISNSTTSDQVPLHMSRHARYISAFRWQQIKIYKTDLNEIEKCYLKSISESVFILIFVFQVLFLWYHAWKVFLHFPLSFFTVKGRSQSIFDLFKVLLSESINIWEDNRRVFKSAVVLQSVM